MLARSITRFGLPSCLLLASLVGCGSTPSERGHGTLDMSEGSFGAEDKRVARALSLGAGSNLDKEGSPYAQALACKIAYDDVSQRLSQPGMISTDQRRFIETVGDVLRKRLASFAASAGKSSAEVERDSAARVASGAGSEANMRVLISCLRKLQEDAER